MNLTDREAAEAIVTRWVAIWGAASFSLKVPGSSTPQSTVTYGLPDETFEPPADGSSYATLDIAPVIDQQSSMASAGAAKFERLVLILVKLAWPLDVGRGAFLDMLAVVRQAFEGVRFGGVECYGPIIAKGARTQERWRTAVVECPARYYQTH